MDLATAVGDDFSQLRQSLSSSGRTLFPLASSLIQHFSYAPRGGPLFTSPERRTTTMGLGGHLLDPSSIISPEWSRAIRIVATISAGFSVIGTLITIYWFFMMRRNFRRK
jgi:hypothetical protein